MKPGDLAINQAAGRVRGVEGGCLVGVVVNVRFRACYAVFIVGMRPFLLVFLASLSFWDVSMASFFNSTRL